MFCLASEKSSTRRAFRCGRIPNSNAVHLTNGAVLLWPSALTNPVARPLPFLDSPDVRFARSTSRIRLSVLTWLFDQRNLTATSTYFTAGKSSVDPMIATLPLAEVILAFLFQAAHSSYLGLASPIAFDDDSPRGHTAENIDKRRPEGLVAAVDTACLWTGPSLARALAVR